MEASLTCAFASPPSAAARRHSSVGYSAEQAAGGSDGEPSLRMSSWGLAASSAAGAFTESGAEPPPETALSGAGDAGSGGVSRWPRAETRLPTASETVASPNFPPDRRNLRR